MTTYRISQVAERTGFTPATLRYYERIGLLDPADRADNGYRLYDERTLDRLAFIGRAKDLGLALDEIADLARLWDGDRCGPVHDRLRQVVDDKRRDARQRIAELFAFSAELDAALERLGDEAPDGPCDDACGCGPEPMDAATATPVPLGRQADIACTLSAEAVPDRLAEWEAVLARVVAREPISGGLRLHLDGRPGLAGDVLGLAEREQECCAFFEFAVRVSATGVALEVSAPPEAGDLVLELFG